MTIPNPKQYIGETFQYIGTKHRFKLLEVSENGFTFRFNKNYWCTDSIFKNYLIRVKTGKPMFIELLQTKINF